jgi:hypothetical protein
MGDHSVRLYVDSSRRLRAKTGHSLTTWRTDQLDPLPCFLTSHERAVYLGNLP